MNIVSLFFIISVIYFLILFIAGIISRKNSPIDKNGNFVYENNKEN